MADVEIKRIPRINVKKAGTLVGTRPAINLIEGSNITLTVSDDSANNEVDVTIAASGSATPSDFQPAIVTNYYYSSPVIEYGGAGSPGDGSLTAYPIWFSHTETWTRIVANVETGSGTATEKIRLGIWSNNASNQPGALLVDSGELSLQTISEASATISQVLTANTLYWIGSVANDASTLAATTIASARRTLDSLAGIDAIATQLDDSGIAFQRAYAFAALPDPWGTPSSLVASSPAVWLRKV